MKIIIQYVLPIIIIGLIIGVMIYISVKKEGFSNLCACPKDTQLRNGGCLSCPKGYHLSNDYYNAHCISENSKNKIIGPIIKKLEC